MLPSSSVAEYPNIGALMASVIENRPPLRGLFLHQHRSVLAGILASGSKGRPATNGMSPRSDLWTRRPGNYVFWGPASPHCGTMWMFFACLEKLVWNSKFRLIGLTCVFRMSHEVIRRVSEGRGCNIEKSALGDGPIVCCSNGDPRGAAFFSKQETKCAMTCSGPGDTLEHSLRATLSSRHC